MYFLSSILQENRFLYKDEETAFSALTPSEIGRAECPGTNNVIFFYNGASCIPEPDSDGEYRQNEEPRLIDSVVHHIEACARQTQRTAQTVLASLDSRGNASKTFDANSECLEEEAARYGIQVLVGLNGGQRDGVIKKVSQRLN